MKKALSGSLLILAMLLAFPTYASTPLFDGDAPQSKSMQININTASVKELVKLPGIGKSKAKSIVAYRDKHGPFASIKDLEKVEGVGKKVVKALNGKVSI